MKKLLLTLVLLIPFVTGCADIQTRININDDKSASVVTSLTYQGDLSDVEDITAQNITANYPKFFDKMYNIDTVNSKKLSTVTATKKINNLEHEDLDLSSLGFKTNLESNKFIEVKKSFLVKSFNIDMVYDYRLIQDKIDVVKSNIPTKTNPSLNPEYFYKYANPSDFEGVTDNEYDFASNIDDSAIQLANKDADDSAKADTPKTSDELKTTFSIQVPAFASYNNADNSGGNVYTWNISKEEPTVIKLQYVQYSGFAITFVILLGILFLIFVAKKIIKRDSTKRIDNIENIV